MDKGNGYVYIGMAFIIPIILSRYENSLGFSLAMSGICLLIGILCLTSGKRKEQKEREMEQKSTISVYNKEKDSMGKQVFTIDGQIIAQPDWISSGAVAASLIPLFMAILVTMISATTRYNKDNVIICVILWVVALVITAFDIALYFHCKNESIEELRKSDAHMRRKANMVGAQRDRQNNLDNAEALLKQADKVLNDTCKESSSMANRKEGDWAITGGVSQAIGGIGAGVFAAASTIQNNQRIREENQVRTAYRTVIQISGAYQIRELKDNAEKLKKTVVNDYPINENTEGLFSTLSISKEFCRSSWGPILIKLEVHNNGEETVYGSMDISLSNRGIQVSSCPILLPDDGISPNTTGMCYAICMSPRIDMFACVNKEAIKNPWHDSMRISGIKLWTKNNSSKAIA